MTATVRPASTVVLLRQGGQGLEAFLVRRHHAIAFMGGAHVFPGGRVEESDCDAAWLSTADGFEAARPRMTGADNEVLGFHVAAVRETFEEAGVLMARNAAGALVSFAASDAAIVTHWRQSVAAGTLRLLDLLQAQRWRLAIDAIAYFAHWVTPVIETRRFDTRFFLAVSPPGQDPAHDTAETTAGVWVRPAEAIARCRSGAIALPPPTWTTLRWLEPFRDVDAALDWARHKPVPRIEPGFVQRGDTRIVTLPGDETVPAVEGFDAQETRFLLADGRWTPL